VLGASTGSLGPRLGLYRSCSCSWSCCFIMPPPLAVAAGFLLEAAALQLQFNSTRPTPRPTTPSPDLGLCIAVPSGLYRSPIAVPSAVPSHIHRSPIGSPIGVCIGVCIGTAISAVPPPSEPEGGGRGTWGGGEGQNTRQPQGGKTPLDITWPLG
jgi:hypothetical protein